MKRVLSVAKFLIGWPLAAIALFFVFRLFLNQENLFTQFHQVNILFLSIGLILFLAFFFLRALFWQKLLQKKGIHFSYKTTALTWGLAEFKRYVPGSIWPILGRSSAYEKLGSGKKDILKGILHEAQFLIVTCMLISLFSLNFLLFGFVHIPYASFIIVGTVLLVLVATALFLFHQRLLPRKFFLQHLLPQLPVSDMLRLLVISIAAFLLFGLANYFTVSALFPLYLLHILPLTGFFVFAFIAGYLSFLAPMGLGVREAILTAGLAKYLPLSLAALCAISLRLVQIISELLFLGICIVWERLANNNVLKKMESFCLDKKYGLAVLFSVAAYITYFTIASFLRYSNFFAGRFDLGNMDQTVWNTVHGRFFQLTDPNGITTVSRLAFHADFMLILLSPFYFIWQDPRMLLLIQSIALGLSGIFVYLIAKHILGNKPLALSFTLSYLLYPGIQYANLFDFHAVTIAVPLFFAGWYLILRKKFILATLILLLAATVKEEIWLITGLLGVYFAIWKKKHVLGVLLAGASLAVFYYLIEHAIPAAHGSGHFALTYYSDFGATPGSILRNVFLSPVQTFVDTFGAKQLLYLLQLFLPVGFLSFIGFPFLLFAGPDLGISVLSNNAQLHTIYYHYAAIPAPFIFLAAIYGYSFLAKRAHFFTPTIGVYFILTFAIGSTYAFGPLPGAYSPNIAMFTSQLSYSPLIDSFLSSIPKRYSVAATNNIGSHLSHRQNIYTIPVGLKEADIVVFLLNDSFAQPSLKAQKEMARELDKDPAYIKLISYNDFVVYKKKSLPTYYKRRATSILPLFKGD